MLGSVSVGSSVIHVDMNIAAHPLPTEVVREFERVESNYQLGWLIGGHRDFSFYRTIIQTFCHFHFDAAGGNYQGGVAGGMKIVRFGRALSAIETVIGVHPGVFRGVSASVFIGNGDTGGNRLPVRVHDCDRQIAHEPEPATELLLDLNLGAARNALHPQ